MVELNVANPNPGAHSVAALLAAGFTADELRAKSMRRVAYGLVLLPGSDLDPDDYVDRCRAVGATLAPGFFISRRSAAALYGVPYPSPPRMAVEVGAFDPLTPLRRGGLLGHRVRQGIMLPRQLGALTLPSPADVWCQLSAVTSYTELVAAGDALISGKRLLHRGGRRTRPLTDRASLHSAHLRHRGGTGTPLRRRALGAIRSPVDSPQETLLRLTLVSAGFSEPIVNCPVPVARRRLHADLGYPDLKIAIEYEGEHHFSDPIQARRDLERYEAMQAAGWRVIRVVAEDLRDPAELIARVANAIAIAEARCRLR